MTHNVTNCRSCGHPILRPILNVGEICVSTFVSDGEKPLSSRLALVLCDESTGGCGLLQLDLTGVENDLLYRTYWYRSGINASMRKALKEIAVSVEQLKLLAPQDIILDIGANDGTLLQAFGPAYRRVGFEPAYNLATPSDEIQIFRDYFSANQFKKQFGHEKAKVITTIAMFYDIENPHAFVADIKSILHPNGVWINQMSYLPSMLKQNAFDNICHEHLTYYSLRSLEHVLSAHELEISDVKLNDVNGGSFRVTIQHATPSSKKRTVGFGRVERMRKKELAGKLHTITPYMEFAHRSGVIAKALQTQIEQLVSKKKRIHVYGASTKGNTLLQFANLNYPTILAAADRNSEKWGKKTVGTAIPIVSEEVSRSLRPDYLLVLPWHFRTEFIQRESHFLASGGSMIFPLPIPEIVTMKDGEIRRRRIPLR